MSNLNKDIKAFFIDLDGTLLDQKVNGRYTISQANLDQIKEVQKTKYVAISTGRIYKNLEPFLKLSGVDYAVAGGGSMIVDQEGKILYEQMLTLEQCQALKNFFQKYKLVIKVEDERDAYGANTWIKRYLSARFGLKLHRRYQVFDQAKCYHKFVVWGYSPRKLAKLALKLNETVADLAIVSSSHGWTLEVTHKNATKGIANEWLALNIFQVDPSQTAHIGDTMNDSTVIDHVGRLIAMGNASRKLHALADYIGPHYQPHGVAKILQGQYTSKS